MLFFLTSWYKISFGEFRSKSDRLYLGLMCSLLTTALSNQRIFGFLLVRFSSLWDVHNYGAICFSFRALCYFIRFMTKRKQTRQRERLSGKDRAICVILYGRGLVRRTFSQLKQSFSPRWWMPRFANEVVASRQWNEFAARQILKLREHLSWSHRQRKICGEMTTISTAVAISF